MFRSKVTRNCNEKQITWPDDAKHAARNVFAVAYGHLHGDTKQCRLRRKRKQKDSGLGHSCNVEQRGELFADSPQEQFRLGRHLSKQWVDPS
ncbi:hypothetical protein CDAR_294561 [Caerostris darwini]|uniref:Uncharacterized protein n=1 Tax=Caerostris darwini TaxID=1538125 RepID=A0AAV4UKF7_9ARAC|nr:hypothetical protein CDAR_294561 [Caerostris darwini]